MRLLKKYRWYTYTSLCFVISIGFIINYYLFRYSNLKATDRVLNGYCVDIEEYAKNHKTLKPLLPLNSKFGLITFVDADYKVKEIEESIVDTMAYDHYQDKMIVYRKKVFPVKTQEGTYVVRLMLPTLEENYLVGTVVISLILFTLLFILFTTIIDVSFTRQILSPFHKILEAMKTYNIEERTKLRLEKNNIDEFRDLTRILTEMMDKIDAGYFEMKEFLEYTSHELQTPLSIIQLKLEMLNQQDFQDPEVIDSISSIQSSLKRVVRFNRSILFIAKIKNNQYAERKNIDLSALVKVYIKQFEEMLSMRDISVVYNRKNDLNLKMHPFLADHLIQNIFTNAIRHNYDGGNIRITSFENKLIVANTFEGKIPSGDLFEKYNHSSDKKDSSGLGLAIVKTICVKNNIDVDYIINGHEFVIRITGNMKG